MLIIIGAVAGVAVGAFNHRLLRRALSGGDAGRVGHLTVVFWLRYVALALALLVFWLSTHSAAGDVALALAALGSSRFLLVKAFPAGGDQP